MDKEEKKTILDQEFGIRKIFTGKELDEAVENCLDERIPLIEGFLYERNVNQICADDGTGKSSVLLQAVLEASNARNVWHGLPVPKPIKTIWLAGERPLDEPFERIKAMRSHILYDSKNIVIDDTIQDLDLKNHDDQAKMLIRLAELASVWDTLKPDLVVIDPIYAVVSTDMISNSDVHFINHFLRRIQRMFSCAICYIHHTNRGTKNDKGERTGGDMYGSRFLSANLTGLYHLKKTEDGTELNLIKTTYSNLIKHIPLVWNELAQTSSVSKDADDYTKGDRILIFLRKKYNEHKDFQLREISNRLKVSDAYIRKCLMPLMRDGSVTNIAPEGQKGLYRVQRPV